MYRPPIPTHTTCNIVLSAIVLCHSVQHVKVGKITAPQIDLGTAARPLHYNALVLSAQGPDGVPTNVSQWAACVRIAAEELLGVHFPQGGPQNDDLK